MKTVTAPMKTVTVESTRLGIIAEGRYQRGAVCWFLRQWRVNIVRMNNTIDEGTWHIVPSGQSEDIGVLKAILTNVWGV